MGRGTGRRGRGRGKRGRPQKREKKLITDQNVIQKWESLAGELSDDEDEEEETETD